MTLPKRLLDGYSTFRAGRYSAEAERYRRLGEGQQRPAVMIIACCDSRAAPETIFDAGPGEIFVVRNVANLVPPYAPDSGQHGTSAALEFAVLSLGVRHIVVMGHGSCGGIGTVIQSQDPLTQTDFIGNWMKPIRDVARIVMREAVTAEANVQRQIEQASVEHSLANLRTFPWVRVKANRGELSLHGAWFDITLGELHAFDESHNTWDAVPG
jgi:carbonic anhydrase